MVKVAKSGKVKVERDGIVVQVGGFDAPILKVAVADKYLKKSYNSSHKVEDAGLFASAEYRTKVAEQFVDRALMQRK